MYGVELIIMIFKWNHIRIIIKKKKKKKKVIIRLKWWFCEKSQEREQ